MLCECVNVRSLVVQSPVITHKQPISVPTKLKSWNITISPVQFKRVPTVSSECTNVSCACELERGMRYKRTDVSCCDGSWKAHQVFGGKVEQEKSAFTNTVVLLKDENMALKKEVDELKQELQHQHQWHQKHVVADGARSYSKFFDCIDLCQLCFVQGSGNQCCHQA